MYYFDLCLLYRSKNWHTRGIENQVAVIQINHVSLTLGSFHVSLAEKPNENVWRVIKFFAKALCLLYIPMGNSDKLETEVQKYRILSLSTQLRIMYKFPSLKFLAKKPAEKLMKNEHTLWCGRLEFSCHGNVKFSSLEDPNARLKYSKLTKYIRKAKKCFHFYFFLQKAYP